MPVVIVVNIAIPVVVVVVVNILKLGFVYVVNQVYILVLQVIDNQSPYFFV